MIASHHYAALHHPYDVYLNPHWPLNNITHRSPYEVGRKVNVTHVGEISGNIATPLSRMGRLNRTIQHPISDSPQVVMFCGEKHQILFKRYIRKGESIW